MEQAILSEELYYLQDSRGYVGNDMLFWAKDGKGYTTDLSRAHVYTRHDAVSQHNLRETDIPWPKNYIDQRTRPAVDMQYVSREEALSGTGIVLIKPQKPKKQRINCHACGSFMSERQLWGDGCPKCGADNRP